MSRKPDQYRETLEIDNPLATCGGCRFATALSGTWSVEDGRLVFRAHLNPLARRGPDYERCAEGYAENHGPDGFTRITIDGEPLDAEELAALRAAAGSPEAWDEEMGGGTSPI